MVVIHELKNGGVGNYFQNVTLFNRPFRMLVKGMITTILAKSRLIVFSPLPLDCSNNNKKLFVINLQFFMFSLRFVLLRSLQTQYF